MDTMTILGTAMDAAVRKAAILGASAALLTALLLSIAWMLAGLSQRPREL